MPIKTTLRLTLALLAATLTWDQPVLAQGTAFTYQGRLVDNGRTASGSFDLQFSLWNAATLGGQIGGMVTVAPVTVSNGVFTVTLDFGPEAFNGDNRWLEIAVRPSRSVVPHTPLRPRQPLTPAPYALVAFRSTSADSNFNPGGANLADGSNPVLFFSDLASGPRNGNSDSSSGRIPGRDGAIVTIWGRQLGAALDNVQVYCGGAPAASYYSRSDAPRPANLAASHGMQMIIFQISHDAADGSGGIYAVVNGRKSNTLPFTVRPGGIYFVSATGNDDTGTGSWSTPWRTVLKAADTLAPGDIAYIGDGVNQTEETDASACVNLRTDGRRDHPKALVVYPGATARIGNPGVERAFWLYNGDRDAFAPHWVIAKFNITTAQVGVPAYTGWRVIGNYITAPSGDGMDGAIDGQGDDVYVLGNELDQVGAATCSKLYHAIYFKGQRRDDPPRAATESNREIAWNYVHDNKANRAINIYSEQANAAFIQHNAVHDNVILRQRGDGIMLGYYVVGTNWIYNNVVIQAGQGPEWPDGESYHTGIRINTGHEAFSPTVVHCYHNTLYACGWAGAVLPGETGHLMLNPEALPLSTVHFVNNLVSSAGEPYVATESGDLPPGDYRNCWFGMGAAPNWDLGAVGQDPRLMDPGQGHCALRVGSSCIDAGGDVTAIVVRDLLGVIRPRGPAPDPGAYEFAGVAELRLQARIVAGRLVMVWNGGTGIWLQRAPGLPASVWTDVDNSEGRSTLELPAAGPGGFFRLRGY
jgi:hypothetical protein